MAAPTSVPTAEAIAITRFEKRSSGTSGSRTRRSTKRKAANPTHATGIATAAVARERAARSAATTVIESSSAPPKSSAWSCRSTRSW